METRTPSSRARSTSRAASAVASSTVVFWLRLREGLGYREGVADFVNPGLDGPLVALLVEDEARRSSCRGGARWRSMHLLGAGHLRDPLRVDEARCLDARDAGGGELVAKLGPDLGRERLVFVLEAVAGADVDDLDAH